MQIPLKILDRPQVVPGKNENGFVLIVAMLMLLVITLMGISMSTTSTTEVMIAGNERQAQDQFYAADAGVNTVIAENTDPGVGFLVPALPFFCSNPGAAVPFELYNTDGVAGDDVAVYLLKHNGQVPPSIEVASCPTANNSTTQITIALQLGTALGAQQGTGDALEYAH